MTILSSLSSCLNLHFGSSGKTVRCKGPVVETSYDFKDFNSIVVNGSSDMKISQADTFSVRVRANEEVFQYLDYRVEDGVLILQTKDQVQLRAETHDLTITVPCLELINVNGAADTDLEGPYVSDKSLNVVVNGAGDFDFESIAVPSLSFTMNGAGDINAEGLDVEKLTIAINGAGDIVLDGRATKTVISVHGAGDVDARSLVCNDWETHKAGLASIRR